MGCWMNGLGGQVRLTLLWALRDRVLHAVLGVGLLLLLLVPVFGSFSMRQVQESAIALALSAASLTLLVVAAQLGASSIFRDVDRRYTTAVLGLPLSRTVYVLGRLLGLALVLAAGALILGLCSALVIAWAASTYPSTLPIPWATIALAFAGHALKAVMLAAVALLFSCISTSFSFPFFCTLAVWLAGSASQEVYDYVSGTLGQNLPATLRLATRLLYFLLPNFAGFDLHVQAVYALPVDLAAFAGSCLYGLLYAAAVVWVAIAVFSRRELP